MTLADERLSKFEVYKLHVMAGFRCNFAVSQNKAAVGDCNDKLYSHIPLGIVVSRWKRHLHILTRYKQW